MAYIAGQVLAEDLYSRLKDKYGSNIYELTLTNGTANDVVYYYCRENYTSQLPAALHHPRYGTHRDQYPGR